jgi:hypothetical protein
MNDNQLTASLKSVGMTCFIQYFEQFNSSRVTAEELIETLIKVENYTENSASTKVFQARRIIQEGCTQEALRKTADSKKTESWVVEKARFLIKKN